MHHPKARIKLARAMGKTTCIVTPKGHNVMGVIVRMRDAKDVGSSVSKQPSGANQIAIMNALNQLLGEPDVKTNPGGVGWPEPGTVKIILSVDLIAYAFGKIQKAIGKRDNRKANLNRAIQSLIEKGIIGVNNEYVWNIQNDPKAK